MGMLFDDGYPRRRGLSHAGCMKAYAVVSKLVDKPYARIFSTASGCVIGVVDGCRSSVTVDAVYNPARDKSIPHT